MAFLLFLLFQVILSQASSPIVGMIAADLQTFDEFSLAWMSTSGNQKPISNLTTVGGMFPGGMSYLSKQNAVAFMSIGADQFATLFSLTSNKVVSHQGFSTLVLTNVAYDVNLNSIFINGYDTIKEKNYIFNWNPQGSLANIGLVPGIVQVGISTYCPNGHIFFLTIEENDGTTGLARFDTKAGKYLNSVILEDDPEIIMWDYTSAVMWAWIATEQDAGVLVTIDINTGKRNSTIVSFPNLSANGGCATMDFKTKTIYSSLLDIENGVMSPVWVVVDTNSGKYTTQPTSNGFPININFVG